MTDQSSTSSAHDAVDIDADRRIDAVARAAGSELRRPAPERGLLGVRRAKRNRQIVRGASLSTSVVALVIAGFVVAGTRDPAAKIVPATDVATTVDPDMTTPPPESTDPTGTVEPVVPAPSEPSQNAPDVVYTSDALGASDWVETLVDPTNGSVRSVRPVDPARALDVQAALSAHGRTNADFGAVSYAFREVVLDGGTLPADTFPDVDLCAQNTVTVTSPNGSALPPRALNVVVSPDDRTVATLSTDCPEAGAMGTDAVGTEAPFEWVLQVFDARRPELAGRVLATIPSGETEGRVTFSGNGRFVAVETVAQPGQVSVRVFDVDAGTEVDLGLNLDGCRALGTGYSTSARFIGPWVGDSSIALDIECEDRSTTLLVRDLTSDDDLVVAAPTTTDPALVMVEVDAASYSSPGDAWFTFCDVTGPTCWIGHGDNPLVELPGTATASFLPLGHLPGG
jgi:hypothetical protein